MPPNVVLSNTSCLNENKKENLFSWEEVYYYVSTNQIKSIRRSQKVQEKYNIWMKDTLTKYGSIESYLLKNKLKFESIKNKERPPIIILPNDFPYAVMEGIEHILIWSQIPLSKSYIESILNDKFGKENYEWVYWVNPPEIQSVRKLPHVHVFLKNK